MAGPPQQQQQQPTPSQQGAGRGRGMTLPAWMTGGPSTATPGAPPPGATSTAPLFRAGGPPQPAQQFLPAGGQQFRPGISTQSQPPATTPGPPSFNPQQRPIPTVATPVVQQSQPLSRPPLPGPATPPTATSYSFAPPPSQFSQPPIAFAYQGQSQPPSAPHHPVASQSWPVIGGQSNPVGVSGVHPSAPGAVSAASDWQEHVAPDQRRYYYNKRTKQSSWEKPQELMTATERADASTVWKEFTNTDGRKYYYNKVTKQSKWTMPEEMKAAREQAEKSLGTTTATVDGSLASVSAEIVKVASPVVSVAAASKPSAASSVQTTTSPAPLGTQPVTAKAMSVSSPNSVGLTISGSVAAAALHASSAPALNNGIAVSSPSAAGAKLDEGAAKDLKVVTLEVSAQEIEEAMEAMPSAGKIKSTPVSEEKAVPAAEEPPTFANKIEAKNAFKELLESVHVESDWTWEQAMRVIINDKRYGVLKTLGERKQAFNEYLAQRKKQETEEKRLKQKKAREDFLVMLEDSVELTSTMRWSKALLLFEEDPRFLAVEKEREREELFEDYLVDLERKERERAREERKKNLAEYRAYLETCDFVKATSQWRKVQDKLEDDERCTRLDKIDRLEVFQEYIRDLEKQEEEEKKLQKEQLRRKERKNRDEFRKVMDEDKLSGVLNARTSWREYLVKVKEHPAYMAVAGNTSGSTPKELFEDVAEELEKQYHEHKSKIKEVMKAFKITVTTTWTFDKFKTAIAEAGDLVAIAEPNLKLVFEELLERVREKEEKEAKKKRRLAEDFSDLLHSIKAISASSKWEDCRPLLEDSPEYRAIADEAARRKVFDDYVANLQQKIKEKERKREKEDKAKKEKEKERERRKEREKEKEREREKEKVKREKDGSQDAGEAGTLLPQKEDRKKDNKEKEKDVKDKEKDVVKEKDRDRKHKKRHRSLSSEEGGSEKEEKEDTKKLRRHPNEHRKPSRKHGHDSDTESESKLRRHRREREGVRRNGAAEELEDGEVGEDGEIR